MTNIKPTKTGSKGLDFTADSGDQKIAIQVKNVDGRITPSALHTFLGILYKYDGGIFINFSKGKLTSTTNDALK